VGVIVRELTALEIEQFDFSGRIPEMNMPSLRREAAAKTPTRKFKLKAKVSAKRPSKRRPQIGMARTA